MRTLEERRSFLMGKEFETNNCGKCVVTSYNNAKQLTVMFYDPQCYVTCSFTCLERGQVANPLYPSVHGKGFLGQRKGDPIDKRTYNLWICMLARCYDESAKNNLPTYRNVEVCEEWLNFQNFAGWCDSQPFFNAKDANGKSYELDKDLLVKGNKIYSPETCCFVPHRINTLIVSSNKIRGKHPVGVTWSKGNKKFTSRLKIGGNKAKHLGHFDTSEDTFNAYKEAKETLIKEVANEWKDRIDDKVYKALLSYKIEITD